MASFCDTSLIDLFILRSESGSSLSWTQRSTKATLCVLLSLFTLLVFCFHIRFSCWTENVPMFYSHVELTIRKLHFGGFVSQKDHRWTAQRPKQQSTCSSFLPVPSVCVCVWPCPHTNRICFHSPHSSIFLTFQNSSCLSKEPYAISFLWLYVIACMKRYKYGGNK